MREDEKGRALAEIQAQEQKLQVQVEQQENDLKDLVKAGKSLRSKAGSLREQRQDTEKHVATLKATLAGLEQHLQSIGARYPGGIQKAKETAQQAFVEAQAHRDVTAKSMPADYEKLPERNRRAAKAAGRGCRRTRSQARAVQ